MPIIGAWLSRSQTEPFPVDVWECESDEKTLLEKPIDDSIAAEDKETIRAFLSFKYPVPEAYVLAIPNGSRVLEGRDEFYVLPWPVVSGESFELVEGVLQHVGPVCCAPSEEPQDYFKLDEGYVLKSYNLSGIGETRRNRRGMSCSRWDSSLVSVYKIAYDPKAAARAMGAVKAADTRDAITVSEVIDLITDLFREVRSAVPLYGDVRATSRAGMPWLLRALQDVLCLHQVVLGPLAYRNSSCYKGFMRRVKKTEAATLRKWNISAYRRGGSYKYTDEAPFVIWLRQELRSKAWKEKEPRRGKAYSRAFSRNPFYEAVQKRDQLEARRRAKEAKVEEGITDEKEETQVASDHVVADQREGGPAEAGVFQTETCAG